jgi:alpha-beta hydrolase superfamily lysophospholipase
MYRTVSENVTMKLYENGRHEMLNEINRNEVMTDIVSVLDTMIR